MKKFFIILSIFLGYFALLARGLDFIAKIPASDGSSWLEVVTTFLLFGMLVLLILYFIIHSLRKKSFKIDGRDLWVSLFYVVTIIVVAFYINNPNTLILIIFASMIYVWIPLIWLGKAIMDKAKERKSSH